MLVIAGNTARFLLATFCADYFQLINGAFPLSHSSEKTSRFKRAKCSLDDEFTCDNRQCISKWSVCDGRADCDDKSDESEQICGNYGVVCGHYFFSCRYGGCVASSKICDGKEDCKDGSDEAPLICGSSRNFSETRTNQLVDGCEVPPSQGGDFILGECGLPDTSPSCIAQTNEIRTFGSELSLRCIDGYSLVGPSLTISCGSSRRWYPRILPSCRRTCEPLVSANLIITCTLTEFENERRSTKTIPCNQSMFEGTKAIVQCSAFFVERTDEVIFCNKSGQWDGEIKECQPLCGFRDQSLSPQIIGGLPASQIDYPWHVGIYWIMPKPDGTLKFDYKCGGSLISPSTVLTAAHCIFNEKSKEWMSASEIALALGKQKVTWDTFIVNRTQILYAKEFKTPSEYTGAESCFNFDVALIILNNPVKLTQYVFPVCVNFSHNRFRQGDVGKVPGWGYTGTNETSEDLLYADIPYMNRKQCNALLEIGQRRSLTFDKFCGGYSSKGPKTSRGDSGGGLVYKYEGINYVVGIVSSSVKNPEFNGTFYTNVSYHGDWIKRNMS